MIHNISCVIIVKNGQNTIKNTLDSLTDFTEVVVYDNGSTDKTIEIVKDYSNVTIIQGVFLGFGPTKNKAISFTKNAWVLSLDADEVLSVEFLSNLKNLVLNEACIYTILRTNYYKESEIKYCWGNDIIVRLFNKNSTSFTNEKVHEKVIEKDYKVDLLEGAVRHYPYSTVSDFIVKLDSYSTIFALDNVGKKKSSPLKAILNALFSFIKTYFFKRGFLDGYAGLIIAFSHMATNFYKYMKLYELNKK
ncbi:glycosyltransferase family 2 protein [Sulfurimonas sp. SAG-AH-194-I05]|nr:glycosyltransferase family 2 protein [Sulfurimonas sp. SAG-AH-194-I05]